MVMWWSTGGKDFTFTLYDFYDTIGSVLFGASLIWFYNAFQTINWSNTNRYRFLAHHVVLLLLAIGTVHHYLGTAEMRVELHHDTYKGESEESCRVYNYPRNEDFTSQLFLMLSGWISSLLVILRAYMVSSCSHWVLVGLVPLLIVEILVQYLRVETNSGREHFAFPVINLVLFLLVTLIILYYRVRSAPEPWWKTPGQILAKFWDISIDCGGILIGVYIADMIAMGCDGDPVLLRVLPHVQNMTSCTLMCRLLVDDEVSRGTIRLGDNNSGEGVQVTLGRV